MKMKFALVNGHKMEPQQGLKGTCINCQSNVIAKYGKVNIWHWAHTHLLLAREILNNISQIIRLQRQNVTIQQARAVYPQYVRRRR